MNNTQLFYFNICSRPQHSHHFPSYCQQCKHFGSDSQPPKKRWCNTWTTKITFQFWSLFFLRPMKIFVGKNFFGLTKFWLPKFLSKIIFDWNKFLVQNKCGSNRFFDQDFLTQTWQAEIIFLYSITLLNIWRFGVNHGS